MTPRFDLLQQNPDIYQAMVAIGEKVRQTVDSTLDHLLKVRASQLNGCAFCIDMHTNDARFAGETEQRLYALNAWREAPFFSETERAALGLCEAITLLHEGHVPDDVYDEATKHLTTDEIAGIVWSVAVANTWNRVVLASRITPGSYKPKPAES